MTHPRKENHTDLLEKIRIYLASYGISKVEWDDSRQGIKIGKKNILPNKLSKELREAGLDVLKTSKGIYIVATVEKQDPRVGTEDQLGTKIETGMKRTVSLQEFYEKVIAQKQVSKHSLPQETKWSDYRKAIIDGTIKLRIKSKSSERFVRDVQISLDGLKWIKLHDFLLNNDWDNTIVLKKSDDVKAVTDEKHTIAISGDEQRAVAIYVADTNDYNRIKSLFNENHSLESRYKFERSMELDDIRNYMTLLILMQSAYNKARIERMATQRHPSVEVYRNIDRLETEVMGDIEKKSSIITAQSVASTTRDKGVYASRAIKLTIQAGSDAIPLEEIIRDESLRSGITISEKENFMGVRPMFLVQGKITKKYDSKQTEYKLKHVSREVLHSTKKIQNLFRKNLKEIHKDDHLSITKISESQLAELSKSEIDLEKPTIEAMLAENITAQEARQKVNESRFKIIIRKLPEGTEDEIGRYEVGLHRKKDKGALYRAILMDAKGVINNYNLKVYGNESERLDELAKFCVWYRNKTKQLLKNPPPATPSPTAAPTGDAPGKAETPAISGNSDPSADSTSKRKPS